MTSQEMEMVLSYIISKMDPKSQDEIKEILGGELPNLGQDAWNKGGLALERCPERLKTRAALDMRCPSGLAADAKPKAPEFPHSGRLK